MKSLLLTNANFVLPQQTKTTSLLIQNGKIIEISGELRTADEVIDLEGLSVFPGFIDIHNHGAVGHDVNTSSADDLIEIGTYLAKNGVTTWLPTLVPDTDIAYRKTIDAIEHVRSVQNELPVAQIAGVHYEGIFANEKMCGALRPEYFQGYSTGTGAVMLPQLENGVNFMTLAPEIENGIELIKALRDQNWIISIGHTKASSETLDAASAAGANHFTHMFNAMTGLHHRDIGVAGWALASERSTFDMIADGIHVDPKILKFAARAKSPDLVTLISDSIAPTGLGDGDHDVWGENISVKGRKTQNDRGSIAGSVITMLDAFKMMRSLGFSNREVSTMASYNPAKLLKLDAGVGSIETGKTANLIAIDDSGVVRLTIVNGRPVPIAH